LLGGEEDAPHGAVTPKQVNRESCVTLARPCRGSAQDAPLLVMLVTDTGHQ